MPREILTPKEIQQMLKLIPNNFPVCLEDLEEIFNPKKLKLGEKVSYFDDAVINKNLEFKNE